MKKNKDSLNFLSLFSGCGGFDLGFHQEGFQSLGAFDINPKVLSVLKDNLSSNVYQQDLTSGELNIPISSDVDVMLAGSPCQGFSTLGKRRIDDPRNNLLLATGHIAKQLLPKVIIAENVPGVAVGKHKIYWETLQSILREAGYCTTVVRCEAVNNGVAQTRVRLFMLAWRTKRTTTVVIPKKEGMVLKDVLQNIDSTPNHEVKSLPLGSKHFLIAQRIKPTQKLCNVRGGGRSVHTWHIPEVFGLTSDVEKIALDKMLRLRRQVRVRDFGDADPIPASILFKEIDSSVITSLKNKGYVREIDGSYDLAHTFNGKYKRLSWDQPSYTVDTRFGDPQYYLHPSEHRGFTVREAARIQGFPDSFVFSGNEKDQYQMIGNAVPPPLARQLAFFIKEALL